MTTGDNSTLATAETAIFDFDDSFARELAGFYAEWQPESVPAPELVAVSLDLAADLGIDPDLLDGPGAAALLSGNAVPDNVTPIALAYAGHQFGGYSPLLGDGRALLLGEVVGVDGARRDIHLKGSGRTPFSRGGDGKAALGPMLREFLIAEAMHALGVATTRALAVTATGEEIERDGFEPGAVLARVAASHIRVGTFEYAARLEDTTASQRLADYSIERHHPQAAASESPSVGLLDAVIDAQARLVAQWMLVGFIHGVMNTDNVTISGEGIDYGPCAFMESYNPSTVFSSIDRDGRYAFGNQPAITRWNLTRFAETLVPLIDADRDTAVALAIESLEVFDARFSDHWNEGMRAKLGLKTIKADDDVFFERFLRLLLSTRADYTLSFRALAETLRGDDQALQALFTDGAADEWVEAWQNRVDVDGQDRAGVADAMDAVNPIYIPRNHLVEHALDAATAGDLDPFRELLDVVSAPFAVRPGYERFGQPAPDDFNWNHQTFCGT